MERVGVRELRQNASVYLRRVQQGERFEVTDRGRPVALLVPTSLPGTVERLRAEGRITPATGTISDLPPPLPRKQGEPTLTEILLRLRDEERF